MLSPKKVSDSKTYQVQLLAQSVLNGNKRLFGGKLMEWIDVVAAVVARRHSNCNVTTAAVDSLVFKKPAYANDILVLEGFITHAGKTSMEICVRTYVEALNGNKELINTAYLVMVAVDERGTPATVPQLIPETDEEKAFFEAAIKRREFRKLRENQQF